MSNLGGVAVTPGKLSKSVTLNPVSCTISEVVLAFCWHKLVLNVSFPEYNYFKYACSVRPDQFNFQEHGSDRPCFCGKQKKIQNGSKIFICM